MNAKNPYKKSNTLPIKKNKGLKFSILFSRKDDNKYDDKNAEIKRTR